MGTDTFCSIGALVDELITIKDRVKDQLYADQVDALNDACNLIKHNFPSNANVEQCIMDGEY
jgi:hypothetical protein